MAVLLFEWNESDRIDSELQPGDTACLGRSRSVWIRTEQGEVEELPAVCHPDYVHVGSLISTDPEINEGSYTNVIGPLGRIGDVYFAGTSDEGWEAAHACTGVASSRGFDFPVPVDQAAARSRDGLAVTGVARSIELT